MLRKHKVKHLAGESCNQWVKLHRPRSNLLPGRSCYQVTTLARKARGKIRIMPKLSNDPASLVIVRSPLSHAIRDEYWSPLQSLLVLLVHFTIDRSTSS